MLPRLRQVFVAAVALGSLSSLWLLNAAQTASVADHHVHMRSSAMAVALQRALERMREGQLTSLAPHGATETLAALDAAGVERAAVVSSAYLFGMPDLRFENEEQRVAAENDFVSAEVSKAPRRLVGFCSVNSLSAYALSELRRCTRLPSVVGIKLHLANSNVDLRDDVHLRHLTTVFREAQARHCPVIIHLHTRRPDYGAIDARRFIEEVLAGATGVQVQVAHMAGGGGSYHDGADDALSAFAEAFRRDRSRRDRVWFDLSGVVYPAADGAVSARVVRAQHERLVRRVREIGFDRVLFGSDWDALTVKAAAQYVHRWLPVTPAEGQMILQNRAAYLDATVVRVGRVEVSPWRTRPRGPSGPFERP